MKSFYKVFEDRFRGSRELINERLKVYLPLIAPIKNLYPDCRAIDLGCGRGEWLELLSANGFQSHGVDIDEGMLENAKEFGLSADLRDALEYLKSLQDDSVGIVSGFHIAEHISFEILQELIKESLRVLKPAGLLILETPNPENITVGSNTFYIDPTHIRPLPPVLLAFLPEYYGFSRVTVFRLNSSIIENNKITLLNVINGVSPDYSVIAQKNANLELLQLFDGEFYKKHGFTVDELATKYEQTGQGRQEMEASLHTLVQLEQEAIAQLLSIKQQAAQAEIEHTHIHTEQVRDLQRQHAEREHVFSEQLQTGQQELRVLELARLQREKEHAEHTSQSQQALENLLRNQVQREQEVIAQLLGIQQQAEHEKAEQARQYSKQERILQHQHAEREHKLIQQQEAVQEKRHQQMQVWVQHKEVLDKEIAVLRSTAQALNRAQQLGTQQHHAELSIRLDQYNRLTEACAALERQLKTMILVEQETSLQLRKSLAEVQQSLATTRASLTWRITAPLRILASLISQKNNHTSKIKELEHSELRMPSVSESQVVHIQPVYIESIMFSSAPVTKPLIPIVAFTLDELLAYQDQQFIFCAYHTLLGRAPDIEGLNYYLQRLRTGISKIQILKQLYLSCEGKVHASDLIGLKIAINRYKKEQYPLVGWLFRFFNAAEGNNSVEKKLRSIENKIFIASEKNSYQFNEILQKLAELTTTQSQENLNFNNKINNRFSKIELLISEFESARLILKTDLNEEKIQKKFDLQPINYLNKINEKYFFNLSTSQHWKAHPVGIIRVERELAKYLSNFINVQFVFWNLETSCFNLLDPKQVKNILSKEWATSSAELIRTTDVNYESSEVIFDDKDTFISIGLDWDLSPIHEISKAVNTSGVKCVFACYDLVPILFPEFCVRDKFDQVFKRHFIEMAHCANSIFVDSNNTEADLSTFFNDSQLEIKLPSLVTIPLASYSAADKLPTLCESDASIFNNVMSNGKYIIYVSSFEARKNHRLLINIWRDLYRERGANCPQLVIVGMKGWGVNDLLQQIPRMPVYLAGKINWLQGISDDLLLHLYKNCSFSVFPSIYEGWGLAASEAMSFGKVCVVSNNSALIQATHGVMPSYHPFDYIGWKKEIDKLLDDVNYKLALEEKINDNFENRTWEEFSKDFCDKLLIN